jgi:hypothetical protein
VIDGLGWLTLLLAPVLFAFGGGDSPSPPPPTPAPKEEDPAAAKERSEAEGQARRLAKKRRGAASTRLSDPMESYAAGEESVTDSATTRRVSVLGGGETRSAR